MEAATSSALRLAHVHVPHLGRRQPNDVSDESAAARARRGSELSYPLDQLFVLVFRSPFVAIESSRAPPAGRHTERTPTHTIQCPQTRPSSPSRPRVLNSFSWYE